MNKKLLRKLAIAACSLTLVASVGFGVSNTLKNASDAVSAAEIVLDADSTWLEDRDYGSVFTVPMGDINGVRATTFTVKSPSGKAYSTERITLTETGKYVVTWYSVVNGKTVTAVKEFFVTKKTIEVSGEATITASNSSVYPFPTAGSIHLNMREGAKFTYNKPVNLATLGENSLLEVFPQKGITNIETAVSKTEYDIPEDASVYYIKLTDAYDPTNVVTIQMAWLTGNYWTVYGNAVGQKPHSLYRTSKGTLAIDSTIVSPHRYTLAFEPGIAYRSYNMSQRGLSFYYDNETNQIAVKATRWYAANGTTRLESYESASTRLVADLSNELIYPGNTFKGFTTGEVYVSITPAGFGSTGEANLDIVSIGGEKMSMDILANKEKDTTAPIIKDTHDFTKYNKIALGEEISVPKVIAADMAVVGDIVADAKVYYNGNTISVKNGKFTPTLKGKYTIVYTATDPSGNKTTKSVDLTCSDTYANAVSLSLAQTSASVDAGLTWTVPGCTVSGLYTDASNVKVYADGKLLEDGKLFVDQVKNYTLTYAYETPFKTYTAECTVTANSSDEVVFSEIYLPEYFIAGASYTLDPVMAQEFLAVKPAPYAAETYMKAGNGAYAKVNYKNVAIPSNASTVQFKYVAANGKYVESDPVKVVNVGFGGTLNKAEYFQSDDATFTKSANEMATTYTMKSGSTMKYVNVLSLTYFKIDFTATNAQCIKFTLTDYYNRDNTLTLELIHSVSDGSNAMEVFVNGISVKKVIGTTFLGVATSLNFTNGIEITTDQLLTGPFEWSNSFTTDKVLVEMSMTNLTKEEKDEEDESPVITGTPSIEIKKFYNNKFINTITEDDSTPMLVLPVNNRGYQTIGKEIFVSQLYVTDLFTPYLEGNLTLEVSNPDGGKVTSKDGVLLDGTCAVDREYTFVLDRLGRFNVRFYYTENGTRTPFNYSCNVIDSVAPTITVADRTYGEVVEAAYRVKVAVATYTVSDDVTDAKKIDAYVYVTYPSGLMKEVAGGKTFDTTEKGIYHVVYVAQDEQGNIATFIYKIKVA